MEIYSFLDDKWRTAGEISSTSNIPVSKVYYLLNKLWKEGKVGKARIYSIYDTFWNNQPVSCPRCDGWQVEQFFFDKDKPVFSYQCYNYLCYNSWERDKL